MVVWFEACLAFVLCVPMPPVAVGWRRSSGSDDRDRSGTHLSVITSMPYRKTDKPPTRSSTSCSMFKPMVSARVRVVCWYVLFVCGAVSSPLSIGCSQWDHWPLHCAARRGGRRSSRRDETQHVEGEEENTTTHRTGERSRRRFSCLHWVFFVVAFWSVSVDQQQHNNAHKEHSHK